MYACMYVCMYALLERQDDWRACGIRYIHIHAYMYIYIYVCMYVCMHNARDISTPHRVESTCREMEGRFAGVLDSARDRLDGYNNKTKALAEKIERLRDDRTLQERAEELKEMRLEVLLCVCM
jgi:hypothetical protein